MELEQYGLDSSDVNISSGQPFARVPKEIRIPLQISAVYVIGNQSLPTPQGPKIVYQIGLQLESKIPLTYESGELVAKGRNHSFAEIATLSYHPKSRLYIKGIVTACGVIPASDGSRDAFISRVLGKQVTALTTWKKYIDKPTGVEKTVVELISYEPATIQEAFDLSTWEVHGRFAKRYPDIQVVRMSDKKAVRVKSLLKTAPVGQITPVGAPVNIV